MTENLIESAAQLAETESLRNDDALHLAAALFRALQYSRAQTERCAKPPNGRACTSLTR